MKRARLVLVGSWVLTFVLLALSALPSRLVLAAPTVTPLVLPNAMQSVFYSQILTISGGVTPYTVTFTAGSLPSGLVLTPPPPPTGTAIAIGGRPTVNGTFNFTIRVTDSIGDFIDVPYTLVIDPFSGAGFSSVPAPGGFVNIGLAVINTSISGNIVISETGNATLVVSSDPGLGGPIFFGAHAADFSITNTLPINMPDGSAAVALTVVCRPTAVGLRSGILSLRTNDVTQPSIFYSVFCFGLSPDEQGFLTATSSNFLTPVGTPTNTPIPTITPIPPAKNAQVVEVRASSVRTGPYLGASLIALARQGQSYPVLAQNGDEGGEYTWYLIFVRTGVQGWVSGRYLTFDGDPALLPLGNSPFEFLEDAPPTGVTGVVSSFVDVRRRPSTRSSIDGTFAPNTSVEILGRTEQSGTYWLHVRANGITGWIPALPVSIRGDLTTVPIH
jgi:hypothetical protein